MKSVFKVSVVFLIFIVTGCAYSPGKFSMEPFPIVGVYEEPKIDVISQVKGDIIEPYQNICRFNVNRRKGFVWGGNSISSGGLLSNDIVISAGHNFYSPWYNTARSFYIECGVGSKPEQPPTYKAINKITTNQIKVSPKYSWSPFSEDISFIKICDPKNKIPNKSPFRLITKPELSSITKGIEVYVSGYPADKPFTGSKLIHFKTIINDINNNVIHYSLAKTYRGMSGGPVWIEKNNERIVIGAHVKLGGAYLITSEMLDEFDKWVVQLSEPNVCH